MSSLSQRSRSGHADRSSRRPLGAIRNRYRRGVLLGALEPLEDRTLLSYAQAATSLAADLQNIESSISNSFNAASAIPILGTQVQQLAPIQNFANEIINTVTGPLNAASSPGDLAQKLTAAMINATPSVLGPAGVQATDDGSGGFIVSADFHTGLQNTAFDSTFSFGLGSFFKAKLDSQIQLQVGIDYLLRFDVSPSQDVTLQPASLHSVAPALPDAPLAFSFDALMTNFRADGTLNGLMHAAVTTPTQGGSVDFRGSFGVDIMPAGGSSFATDVTLSGSLDLPLHIDLSFADSAPINVRLAGDFHLVWNFDDSAVASSNQDSFGTIQTLEISGLSLDLGDLLPGFITSVVSDVQRITRPLQPLVDFVDAEVPGLNDLGVHLSLKTLMGLTGDSGLSDALDAIDFINHLQVPSAQGVWLSLGGTVSFAGSGLSSILAGIPNPFQAVAATDPTTLLNEANRDVGGGGFFADAQASASSSSPQFVFPIVTDPEDCIRKLLAGQNADLFVFKAPMFDAHAAGSLGTSFGGVFGVQLGGSIDVNVALSMGYDTNGLKEFLDGGASDPSALLDGFYVDNGVEADGQHHTGINVSGQIGASASLAGATLGGSLNATGFIGLNSDAPKVYFAQIANPPKGSLFTASGGVTADLDFKYEILGITLFSYNIAQATLIDFNTAINGNGTDNTGPTDNPTISINLENKDQTINVSEQITHGAPYDDEGGAHHEIDNYAIVVDYGDKKQTFDQGTVDFDPGTHEVYGILDPHAYTLIQTAPSETEPTGNHTIKIESGVFGSLYQVFDNGAKASLGEAPINAVLVGGSGNDDLEYHASGQAFLVGGGGSNRLVGGQTEYGNYIWPGGGLFQPFSATPPFPTTVAALVELSDMVVYEGGVDPITQQIRPGVGGNTLIGTGGDDLLVGGPSGNFFDGGSGDDAIYGGIGANYYDVSGGPFSGGETVTIDSGSTNSAGVNTNEVLVHSAIGQLGGQTSLVDASIGEGDPLPYDQYILGDATHKTLTYSDPNSYVSLTASGIRTLNVVGDGTYDVGNLDGTTVSQVAIDLSLPSNRDGSRNLPALPDSVAVHGYVTRDVFTVGSVLDHGNDVTTVNDSNPGHSAPQTAIRNLGALDTLTLNGAGGGDLFVVNLNTIAPFTTSVSDTGSNELRADGSAFTFGATNLGVPVDAVTLYENDSIGVTGTGVDFAAGLRVGATNGLSLATAAAHVRFDGSISQLTVVGGNGGDQINVNSPAPARIDVFGGNAPNSFQARSNDRSVTLEGGAADDAFDVGGTTAYTLDGRGGNDTYTLRWDAANTTNIADSGATGENALIVDDTGNSANDSTSYQVTSGRIVRESVDIAVFYGITVRARYNNTANFTNVAQIALETGDGTRAANQVDIYPMAAGTDLRVDTEQGSNHIDVIGTAARSSTTINAGSGTDDVAVSGITQTVADIAGVVTVNGNGATAVTLDDQGTKHAFSPTSYDVTPEQVQVTRFEFNNLVEYPVFGQIGYSRLASLVINPVLSSLPNLFSVGSTAGTALLVLNTGLVAQVTVGSSPTYLDGIGNVSVVGSGVQAALVIDDTEGTGLPSSLPEGVIGVTSSVAYTVTGQDVQRSAGYGYATADGGGGGASLADIRYQGIDSLELHGSDLGAPFSIADTSVPTLVAGGSGPDTFAVGRSLDAIDSLRINGGGGTNGLTIDDSLGTGVIGGLPVGATLVNRTIGYTVTGQDVSRASSYGYVTADGGGFGGGSIDIAYQAINSLEFDAGAGAAIDVEGTSATTRVSAGAGNTRVDIAAQGQTLDNLAGALTIEGNGTDGLDVHDEQSAAGNTYDIAGSTLDRTGIARITYTAFANLSVHSGTGRNLLYVESTTAGTATDVYGGAGTSPDEFWVFLYSLLGPVNLHGQSNSGGESVALLYDYLNPAPGTYTLTAGALNRTGMAPVTYDGIVEDQLYTSALAAAAVNVQGNAAGVSTYIVAGPGDPVTVGSQAPAPGSALSTIHGAVIFSSYATGAAPSVTIDDSGDASDNPQVSINSGPAPYNFQVSGLGSPAPAQFIFGTDPAASVNILCGGGNDTVKVAGSFSAPGLRLDGGGGNNALLGPDVANTWTIAGNNAGTLDGKSFVNFSDLTGGALQDTFRFVPPGASIGNVTGGPGATTLDYTPFTTPVNVNLGNGTNGTATAVRGLVRAISAVIGGSGNDGLNAGTVPQVALTGGPGINSLIGAAPGDHAVEWTDSNYTLTNTRIAGANTGLIDNLSGITSASLTGSSLSQNAFDVSAWTGTGSLAAPLATGTVTARKKASFTLADASLVTTDGMSMSLSGITSAALTATVAKQTFTTDNWTGGGSLTGSASQVFATKAAGFNLTDTLLSSPDGLHVSLSGVSTANLTVNGPSGSPLSVVDATAFTGVTNLTAAGTAHAILFGGQGSGSTLSATGSSNSVLVGGPGKTTLTDTSTGRNLLIGGPKAVSITGNGNDILVSGATLYDSNTSSNIAALDAILAAWSSADSYSTRVGKITAGVGPGQAYALNANTCQASNRPTAVSDGIAPSQNNWFVVDTRDKVTRKSNETVTSI